MKTDWTVRIGYLASMVVLTAFVALCGEPLTVTELVTTVKQDSPVQVAGFKLPTSAGASPDVVLNNTTQKWVRQVRLKDYMGNPSRSADPNFFTSGLTEFGTGEDWNVQNHEIRPGAEAEFTAKFLRPFLLAFVSAPEHDSNCWHVAVFVSKVEFTDGTAWEDDSAHDEALWRDSIRPESSRSCIDSPDIEQTLKDVKAVTYSPTPPARPVGTIQKFYLVSCPVQSIEGALTAVCDW